MPSAVMVARVVSDIRFVCDLGSILKPRASKPQFFMEYERLKSILIQNIDMAINLLYPAAEYF